MKHTVDEIADLLAIQARSLTPKNYELSVSDPPRASRQKSLKVRMKRLEAISRLQKVLSNPDQAVDYLMLREGGLPPYVKPKLKRSLLLSFRYLRRSSGIKVHFQFYRRWLHIEKTFKINPLSPRSGNTITTTFLTFASLYLARKFRSGTKIDITEAFSLTIHVICRSSGISDVPSIACLRKTIDLEIGRINSSYIEVAGKEVPLSSWMKMLKVLAGSILIVGSANKNVSFTEIDKDSIINWSSAYILIDDIIDDPLVPRSTKEEIFNILNHPKTSASSLEGSFLQSLRLIIETFQKNKDTVRIGEKLIASHYRDMSSNDRNKVLKIHDYIMVAGEKAAYTRAFHYVVCGLPLQSLNLIGLIESALRNQFGDDIEDLFEDLDAGRETAFTYLFKQGRHKEIYDIYMSIAEKYYKGSTHYNFALLSLRDALSQLSNKEGMTIRFQKLTESSPIFDNDSRKKVGHIDDIIEFDGLLGVILN